MTLTQTIQNEDTIDVELRDQAFIIEVNNLFVQIAGNTPDNINSRQQATYLLTRDAGETDTGGSNLTFTIQVKSITNSQFTTFGTTQDKNTIKTFVKITGVQSGAVQEFQVNISKTL